MTIAAWATRIVQRAVGARVRHDCGLRSHDTVLRLLTALQGGLSQVKAARSAGVSEAGLRLWIAQGRKDPDGAYGPVAVFVDALAEARRPKPLPVVAFVAPTPPPAPKPVPPRSLLAQWSTGLARAEQLAVGGQVEASAHLRNSIQSDMSGYDLSASPIQPRLNLPRGLPWAKVAALYTQWCSLRGRGPTDMDVELNAQRWYAEQQAPESEACAAT